MLKVLYEDNHLIAVVKSAGMLSQRDKTGDVSILDEVREYLKEKYKKPGNVFLGLLHRLDRPVSGIILLAKTSKGASRLSEQFRENRIKKTYSALVLGKPKSDRGVLVDILSKKNQKASVSKKGKEAVLAYEVVSSNEKYSLLKINLETGKFHQIRAQLSHAGFPIIGDVKYGGPKWRDEKSIALAATELSFTTATDEKEVILSIKVPEGWKKFL